MTPSLTGLSTSGSEAASMERRVRIPADVDREDRLLAGLTARQLALLAVPAVLGWAAFLALRRWVPLPALAALGAPVGVLVVVLAVGRRDGLSMDRFAWAALRQARTPRRLVPAPEGLSPSPLSSVDVRIGPNMPRTRKSRGRGGVGALVLPCRDLGEDGVLDLGPDGAALVCAASAISFALRSPLEQQGLLDGFGHYLNSLTLPVQILLRARPVDLTSTITQLRIAAGGLPHPALEAAARSHAEFLTDLASTRELLARDALLVLRDPTPGPDAAGRLHRAAADAATALGGCGVVLRVLGGPAAAHVLAEAADPWSPPRPPGLSQPTEVITGTDGGSTTPEGLPVRENP